MHIPNKYRETLLVALEEYMYKLSLELNKYKGQPMTQTRRDLTNKQRALEDLQHIVSSAGEDIQEEV